MQTFSEQTKNSTVRLHRVHKMQATATYLHVCQSVGLSVTQATVSWAPTTPQQPPVLQSTFIVAGVIQGSFSFWPAILKLPTHKIQDTVHTAFDQPRSSVVHRIRFVCLSVCRITCEILDVEYSFTSPSRNSWVRTSTSLSQGQVKENKNTGS